MKLSERLKQSADIAAGEPLEVRLPSSLPAEAPDGPAARVDPIADLKRRAQDAVLTQLGADLLDPTLSSRALHSSVVDEVSGVIESERIPLNQAERHDLVAAVTNDVLGYGPIEEFLADPDVSEIMINSLDPIYVERGGKLFATEARFHTEDHLKRVIERMVARVGRRIDELSPMVDARLPDGSRINAIIPPLALDGPVLTIRKFSRRDLGFADLVELETLTKESAEFLAACVRGRMNVLISGGTGSGKTTLLNALSSAIPSDERIVTIEDAAELQLKQRHVVRLEGRPANIEGKAEVRIRDLVRNALRMRPDRIVVGEVRGAETLDMLQAMNTGHDGSLATLHANSPRDALIRIETMVLMSGFDLPVRAIREHVASALDVLVHISRMRDGRRQVTRIAEVEGMEGDVVTLSDIYVVKSAQGPSGELTHVGRLESTGIRPKFTVRLAENGVDLPARLFGVSSPRARRTGPQEAPA